MAPNDPNTEEERRKFVETRPININIKRNNKEETKNINKEDLVPPDGGWGWLVVLGSLTVMTLSTILVPTYGLVYSSLFKEHNTSSTTVSWIFNMNQFFWNMTGIFVGPLANNFGMRNVSFFGGFLISISIIISGYVQRPEYLFIVYSLIFGIGQGMSVMVSVIIVPYYFDKRKGMAIGISMVGICAGHFVGPFLVSLILEHYGYRGMTLILGAILLNICAASMLFQPPEWHLTKRKSIKNEIKEEAILLGENDDKMYSIVECKKERRLSTTDLSDEMSMERTRDKYVYNSHSLSCLKNNSSLEKERTLFTTNQIQSVFPKQREQSVHSNSFIIQIITIFQSVYSDLLLWLKYHKVKVMTIAPTLTISCFVNYLMMVPFAMTEAGYTLHEVSWALTSAGISNTLSRVVITFMTDLLPISTKYYFMVGSFALFLAMYGFTFVAKMEYIIFFMSVMGVSSGICNSLISLLILEFMGIKFLPQILGLVSFFLSILFVIIGPAFGAIRDATGSYKLFFRLLGIGPLVGLVLWLLFPCAISSDKKRDREASGIKHLLE